MNIKNFIKDNFQKIITLTVTLELLLIIFFFISLNNLNKEIDNAHLKAISSNSESEKADSNEYFQFIKGRNNARKTLEYTKLYIGSAIILLVAGSSIYVQKIKTKR